MSCKKVDDDIRKVRMWSWLEIYRLWKRPSAVVVRLCAAAAGPSLAQAAFALSDADLANEALPLVKVLAAAFHALAAIPACFEHLLSLLFAIEAHALLAKRAALEGLLEAAFEAVEVVLMGSSGSANPSLTLYPNT
jgi:hypothetical protein